MANDEHVAILKKGVAAWNRWRDENPDIRPDLYEALLREANLAGANLSVADLTEANLIGADLREANLYEANLSRADLRGANLSGADLFGASLGGADLREANLYEANLCRADLRGELRSMAANLSGANLSGADLSGANLSQTELQKARLSRADLSEANLSDAILSGTDLSWAHLRGAHLRGADLRGADLRGADLQASVLVETDFTAADLSGCKIYGVSAWGLKLDGETKQQNLVITREDEPAITVDDIEIAQFVYLLLHNEKIRKVIDTIGRKGVLLLGRFTEGRIEILERLREELRSRGYLPIIFNFDKPETKNFTETVRLLAGLSHFVIADVTNPKSAPLELQATVPEVMVPFRPIIQEGEKPFAMLEDLWIQHREWVFEPLYYSSLDALVGALDEKIIKPAKARFAELLARKAEKMKGEHV